MSAFFPAPGQENPSVRNLHKKSIGGFSKFGIKSNIDFNSKFFVIYLFFFKLLVFN